MDSPRRSLFAIVDLAMAAMVPVLIAILARAYSESPFGNAPQMFLVMSVGAVWSLVNVVLCVKEGCGGIAGKLYLGSAVVSASPMLYYLLWNLFYRTS